VREPERRPRVAPIPRSVRNAAATPREQKRSFLGGLMRLLLPRRASDAVAVMVAFTATVIVIVNAVALQRPSEPAAPAPAGVAARQSAPLPPLPPKRPAQQSAAVANPTNALAPPASIPNANSPAVKARVEMIVTVQRELAQRGYYDGALDGLPGPRTVEAIKEFEQSQGLRITGEASEQLLGHIRKARHRSEITGSIPRADETKQSTRILGIQRTLSRLGYGPLKFSGLHDASTRAAIERFERDRGMPVTGEVSTKVQTELVQVTGTALD